MMNWGLSILFFRILLPCVWHIYQLIVVIRTLFQRGYVFTNSACNVFQYLRPFRYSLGIQNSALVFHHLILVSFVWFSYSVLFRTWQGVRKVTKCAQTMSNERFEWSCCFRLLVSCHVLWSLELGCFKQFRFCLMPELERIAWTRLAHLNTAILAVDRSCEYPLPLGRCV